MGRRPSREESPEFLWLTSRPLRASTTTSYPRWRPSTRLFVSLRTTAFLTSLRRAMVTMNDPRAPEEALRNLTVARTHVQQAWNLVGELRGYARGAEQAVEDAQDQSARARLAPDEEYSSAHLASAGQQLELVRVRCALTSSLASEIQDRLELAQRHVVAAREGLDDYERAGDLPAGAAAELASLRVGLDNLSVLVELAAPLAEAARTHMGAAVQAAAAPATSNRADTYWESMAVQVDHGVHAAGRAVARGDEASRHLDRTVGHVDARAGRAMRDAGAVVATAVERLRSAQHRTPVAGPPGPSAPGPTR